MLPPEHVILVSDNEFIEEEDPSEDEMFEDDEFLDVCCLTNRVPYYTTRFCIGPLFDVQ